MLKHKTLSTSKPDFQHTIPAHANSHTRTNSNSSTMSGNSAVFTSNNNDHEKTQKKNGKNNKQNKQNNLLTQQASFADNIGKKLKGGLEFTTKNLNSAVSLFPGRNNNKHHDKDVNDKQIDFNAIDQEIYKKLIKKQEQLNSGKINKENTDKQGNKMGLKGNRISFANKRLPKDIIKKGRQLLANNLINEAIQEFQLALQFSVENKCLLDSISSGYHLGSSYVMQLQATEAISTLLKTVGYYKELNQIKNLDNRATNLLKEYEKNWKDAKYVFKNSESYCAKIKGYKLYYHMAKAFELNRQMLYAADYYRFTLDELVSVSEKLNLFENQNTSNKNNDNLDISMTEQNLNKAKTAKIKFAAAVEKVTLQRIMADANLRLAICLLKLNSGIDLDENRDKSKDNDENNSLNSNDDFLCTSVECISISMEIYRDLGNRELDLAYAIIWFLRAHYLAKLMDRNQITEEECEKLISEAESYLSNIDQNRQTNASQTDVKQRQKLKNELGFVAGQLSLGKAQDLLSGSIDRCQAILDGKTSLFEIVGDKSIIETLKQKQEQQKAGVSFEDEENSKSQDSAQSSNSRSNGQPILKKEPRLSKKEKSWVHLQKARAENGLSEYYHNTGNKRGAFKILLQASKDYGYAGNERQRAKCLILAVDNGVKFMLRTASRRKKHSQSLLEMLEVALNYYRQYDFRGMDESTMTNTNNDPNDINSEASINSAQMIYQAYQLKCTIHEVNSEYSDEHLDKAIESYQLIYHEFQLPNDLDKLTDLLQIKAERKLQGITVNEENQAAFEISFDTLGNETVTRPIGRLSRSGRSFIVPDSKRDVKTFDDFLKTMEIDAITN